MELDSRYQIIEKAGSGGMAIVYRARDTVLNRDVAIKVLHPHLIEKEEIRKRFLREAQAIARLKHKNIIEIFDYRSDSTSCYIVSEFIKGKNLASFLSECDISSPFIAAMIAAILSDAVGHAHKNNVIHRDLKPENILISENFQLKITDFGIAHITDAENLTITGSISGSPAHMSPEQIDGKVVDHRTDIFSLGTILYLISCGELPFKGTSPVSIFKSILLGDYKDPKEINPIIDHNFSIIIQRCLKKNINERYSSCEELRNDLIEYLKQYGIYDIERELELFFKAPIESIERLQHKIISHLKEYLKHSIYKKENSLQIQDYINILLHLAPDDEDAKTIFKIFSNQINKRIPYTLLILSLLIFVIFYLLLTHFKKFKTNDITIQDTSLVIDILDTEYTIDIVTEEIQEEEATTQKIDENKNKVRIDTKIAKRKILQPIEKNKGFIEKGSFNKEATRFGDLNLFIKPYGDVYLDDKLIGREKATLNVKVESGRHIIRVKNPFFFDIEREVNIEPDVKTDLRLVFDKIKPAKIFIHSPIECDIYIDNNPLGRSDMYHKSGITIPINTKDGKREITIKASRVGYKDFIKKVELTAGETKIVKINLIKEQ